MADEMIDCAAVVVEDLMIRHLGRDLGTIHRDAILSAGIAAALRVMADEIDRGPTFPLPPSVISALVRERADGLDAGVRMSRDEAAPCGHCCEPLRGYASAYRAGSGQSVPLCHPDDGMDCYRLVTVYRHPMPCRSCTDVVEASR